MHGRTDMFVAKDGPDGVQKIWANSSPSAAMTILSEMLTLPTGAQTECIYTMFIKRDGMDVEELRYDTDKRVWKLRTSISVPAHVVKDNVKDTMVRFGFVLCREEIRGLAERENPDQPTLF